jgi:ankyrin repeat protein
LDSNGWSALTYAVWYSQYDNIRFLLEKGADLALADKQDRTLVMLAMIRDKREIIRLLKHEAPQIVHDRQEKKRKELEAKVAAFSPVLKKPMPLPKSPFTRKK